MQREQDLVLSIAVDDLTIILMYEERASYEAFGCGDDVKRITRDIEREGEVVYIAINNGLLHKKFWVAVVNVSGLH